MMRDIALTLLLLGLVLPSLRNPWVGAAVFCWISLMNPHRSTWGFAYDLPWAQAFAVITIAGILWAKEKDFSGAFKQYWPMVLYMVWGLITTLNALRPETAWVRYVFTLKIHVMVLVTLILCVKRQHLWALVWIFTISIGYYGTKGGIFTIATGGNHKVWGPSSSMVEENNSLAVAVLMCAPMFIALRSRVAKMWQKHALTFCAIMCFASSLGSHSRGALIAMTAVAAMFTLKSKHKLTVGIAIVAAAFVALPLMPAEWWERMNSINNYQEDASAMGRINVWKTAVNIANDRITGAGYEYYHRAVFAKYAPNPEDVHSAHSIYFQSIGEQGWIGFAIFVGFWLGTWFKCGRVIRRLKVMPGWESELLLARMTHVSILAFLVGGAFLNIGYWDGAFYVASFVMILDRLCQSEQTSPAKLPRTMTRRQAFSAA